MYDRNREIELKRHLTLGVEHMLNTLDERRDYLPFFHYELIQQPTCIKHGPFDSPQVVGRYLDALGRCAGIIELPDVPEIYDALARQLYDSLQRHPSGLPWNAPTPWQPNMAVMHNCREVVLGLLALMHWRGDGAAKPIRSTPIWPAARCKPFVKPGKRSPMLTRRGCASICSFPGGIPLST